MIMDVFLHLILQQQWLSAEFQFHKPVSKTNFYNLTMLIRFDIAFLQHF